MNYYNQKPRFRKGAVIGLDELKDKGMKRELDTELSMSKEYIGFFDHEDYKARVFIFENEEGMKRFIKEAKKIGYIVGEVAEIISIRNSDLQRPHLNNYKNGYSFYKELYK